MTKVILSLNPELQAYIRTEFEAPEGAVKIHRKHSIGRFINSMLRFSKDIPIRSYHKSTVELIIPGSPYIDAYNYYAYFTAEDERKITDFIQAHFILRIEKFFIQGYRAGFKQKDIIVSMLYYFNLPNISTTYEKFKKHDFRMRISVKKTIIQVIKNI